METPDRSQAKSWEGKDVVDRDGDRLGRCVGVFADTATGVPEWLHVDVEGHVRSFVPAIEAAEVDGAVRVRFAREAVVGAPSVGDDDELSKAEEIDLYRHYGIPVDTGDGSVLPADDATVDTGTTTGTTTPVAGISDDASTGASTTSGAETTATVTEHGNIERERDEMGDTTAIVPTASGTRDDEAGTSALADADTVTGGAVTPETGEQLPVLDPAAASTPVPEDQVTYVSEPRDGVPEEPEPAAEQPRPTLRRVPPASPPPQPQPQPSSSGSDLSALAPLGAVAGVAAAVAVVLQARDRRARRRNSATARADRLGRSLRAGSTVALASASSALAGVPDVADRTRKSAAVTTAKASRAAAKRQQRAAAAARRQRAQTAAALAVASKAAGQHKQAAAASLGAASKSATKAAAQRKQAAAASLGAAADAATKSVAQQRKAAEKSLAKASKATAKQRNAAEKSLAKASKATAKQRKKGSLLSGSSRGSSATDTVAAVPAKVAKRGRKVRKSLARKIWNAVVLGTAGGGYVMGAKAGRQRYDELSQVASAVAASPKVQAATEAVTDPERRADLLAEVQQQAGSLVGRRGEPRS